MNYGYQNEYDFIQLFDNKFLNELDNNLQQFLKELYGGRISNDDKIKCFKNRLNQKSDIFIKYKNIVKDISLKCGNSNSFHHEPIQKFKNYLEKFDIPYPIINYYVSYHYGYKRDINGKIDFSISLISNEYKCLYQNELIFLTIHK